MALATQYFDSADELNHVFASEIAKQLVRSIDATGSASLFVSGGRTPVSLFQTLSKKALPWDRVKVALVDERWVDETDDASNTKLVKTHLLVNEAAAATYINIKTPHFDAYDAQADVEAKLQSIAQPFTVIILGMGEDGHTASLFPCSAEVAKGIDPTNHSLCLAATPTTAPHQRMSLTLNAIAGAENIYLHLTGEKKKTVLQQAMEDEQNPKPIVSVIQRAEVTLYWAP